MENSLKNICPVCESVCGHDSGKYFSCDSCKRPFHVRCSGLSMTETRYMEQRAKRILQFLCDDCACGLKLVPSLLSKLSILGEKVEKLSETVTKQQQKSNGAIDFTYMIEEMADRNERKRNIMIYNVAESNSASSIDRKTYDDKIVRHTINLMCNQEGDNILKMFRVGKPVPHSKPRPIKVILKDEFSASFVLKNRDKCVTPIKVCGDMTLMQRTHLRDLRKQLEFINKDNVTKTIKYVNGQPRIVNAKNYERKVMNTKGENSKNRAANTS